MAQCDEPKTNKADQCDGNNQHAKSPTQDDHSAHPRRVVEAQSPRSPVSATAAVAHAEEVNSASSCINSAPLRERHQGAGDSVSHVSQTRVRRLARLATSSCNDVPALMSQCHCRDRALAVAHQRFAFAQDRDAGICHARDESRALAALCTSVTPADCTLHSKNVSEPCGAAACASRRQIHGQCSCTGIVLT
jgi:hypothetical protein